MPSKFKIDDIIEINNHYYRILELLGRGKGGYSFLAINSKDEKVVLKEIHHEPCDYYQFGNKIESEINDYNRLKEANICVPLMIEFDKKQEIIIKEYIDGKTILQMKENGEDISEFIPLVEDIANLAKSKGLNIDYYPTNFIPKNGKLYYIDYECNAYMEEWSFENWGNKYW